MLKYKQFTETVLASREIDADRIKDPIPKSDAKEFLKSGHKDGDLTDDIVKTSKARISANKLKPSQDSIYLGKALGLAIKGIAGRDLGSLCSRDNFILDGHHRWAATIFNNPNNPGTSIDLVKVDLNIGDLIPVLRAIGDALGNERRGEPSGGDVNIFKCTIDDALDCIFKGANMNKKFYNRDEAIEWFNKVGGEESIRKSLAILQAIPPPHAAPPRFKMPVLDALKSHEKIAADLLRKGAIDIKPPYRD